MRSSQQQQDDEDLRKEVARSDEERAPDELDPVSEHSVRAAGQRREHEVVVDSIESDSDWLEEDAPETPEEMAIEALIENTEAPPLKDVRPRR